MTSTEEQQYFDLIRLILTKGTKEIGRNGVTQSIFGNTMRFSLDNGCIPFMTHKRLAWRTCLTELIWFIRGITDNQWLNNRGVHIWDGNASREFLDSRGLTDYATGDLGPIYGYQWRHFNGYYSLYNNSHSIRIGGEDDSGIDQLVEIITALRDPIKRTSRQLILSAWNPQQLSKMALPPCHVMCQFRVTTRAGANANEPPNQLSCALYQRSGDVGLGVPFNIASYAALTHLLAAHCGLVAHEFVYFLGDAHIYENHLSILEQMVTEIETKQRHHFAFPTIHIARVCENINDYDVDDFVIENYQYDSTPLKLTMVV